MTHKVSSTETERKLVRNGNPGSPPAHFTIFAEQFVDICSLISAVVVGKNNFLPASKVHHCSKPGRYVDNHGILRLLGRFLFTVHGKLCGRLE